MGVKFFGQFLLERKIVKPEELALAVEYWKQRQVDFGDCAIAKGYMTKEDIALLKEKQREVDKRFGEIATEMNLVTPTQVADILETQKTDNIYLGEALVKNGFITRADLERELSLFREDQREYSAHDVEVPADVENPEVVKEIVSLTQKLFNRVARLVVKFDNVIITREEPERNFAVISISLIGTHQYEYCLSLPETVSRTVTSAITGDAFSACPPNLVVDGIREFCNIVCGSIIAKLSQQGKIVDISVPHIAKFSNGSYHLVQGRRTLFYSLVSVDGEGALLLIEKE